MKRYNNKGNKTLLLILFIIAVVFTGAVMIKPAQAEGRVGPETVLENPTVDDFVYRINYLGFSDHHSDSDTTNEEHHGFGMSVTLPNNATYGFMRYKNSYGDMSTLLSISTEFLHYDDWHFGVGGGYVSGYGDNLDSPLLGWGTIRYKWITVNTVPSEVTAIGLSIPLEDIKDLFR